MRMIDPGLISVVIQGPLYRKLSSTRGIEACITSIRRHLPGAEVIVSTWPDEDISGLDADLVLQSKDPGPMRDCSGSVLNTNRQLVSTKAGIQASTRPYVMKFRADHNLTSPTLASLGEYAGSASHGRLFAQPLTITNLFIRNPARCPMLYHISDLVIFGTREDMLKFWDLDIFSYEEIFNQKPNLNPFGNYLGYSAMKMIPEQSYMIALLRKHGLEVDIDHPCQVRSADLALWESVLHADFRTLEWRVSGVDFPERFMNNGYSMNTLYGVKDIRNAAELGPTGRRLRRAQVWVNQYLLNCLRLAWWVSFASIVLFATSPSLAKRVRSVWKMLRGVTHPNPEKN
ncbi:TPA: WavE lipopolysaccharide synthesis family protein [Pseudomonas aeruginosa]